jgi:ribosomal protein L35
MKLKTRKSAFKRIKIKKDSLARKKAYRGHLLRTKNSKRMRRLSESATVDKSNLRKFYRMIPYH